ncbi:MAG: autotransporter domain-containing protein [Reyranellaceae bacterium]
MAGLAVLLALSWSADATAQQFVSQGPAPSIGVIETVQSGDLPVNAVGQPQGSVAGAIQAIAMSPANTNVIYAGTPNGGIWVSRDTGVNWQPLSDRQTSLSISSLAFDPLDPSGQKLIAGIGLTSSTRQAGQLSGLLYSSNGGQQWQELRFLADKNIMGVAARGTNLLAGADGEGGGLFYSDNSGTSFTQVAAVKGGVKSLAADSSNTSLAYISVSGAADPANNGVFKINPTTGAMIGGGRILPLAANEFARLATGPNGSVVAAIITSAESSAKLARIALSQDGGATWSVMRDPPNTNPGGQANTHFAVAIDQSRSNVVYVAGDAIDASPYIVPAFRVTLTDGNFTSAEITNPNVGNGSAHADARAFAFDVQGNMLMGGDGGFYVRTNPTGDGSWTGRNSSLSTRELYALAYDGISKRLVGAAQDTGSALQNAPGSTGYSAIGPGDGLNAVVNDSSYSDSIIYTTSQSLSPLVRRQLNAKGETVGTPYTVTTLVFQPDDLSQDGQVPFGSRIILNRVDPTKMAVGTNYIYTTTDGELINGTSPLTLVGKAVDTIDRFSTVNTLAYGTEQDVGAILAGSSWGTVTTVGGVWLASRATDGKLVRAANYQGAAPTSVTFDARTSERFYVADGASLWTNDSKGADTAFTNITPDADAYKLVRPTALEYISRNNVNALLVAGLSTVAGPGSPLLVTEKSVPDSKTDWTTFGLGLPNVLISQLSYNPKVDVLAIATLGRGAWVLYDVTTYFASADKLVYGTADNDSAPEAKWLSGNRPLIKQGTGTLTIGGNATYTGSTTVESGTMVVDGSIASSSDLVIRQGGTVRGTGVLPSTLVSGTIWPGSNAMGTLTVGNGMTFARSGTFQVDVAPTGQNGRIAVTGSTAIEGGTVSFMAAPGTYAPRTRYTILTSSGGVSGSFDALAGDSPSPFLQTRLAYDAQDVYLDFQIGGFAAVAQNPTQYAVGAALDASAPTATGDYANVLSTMAQLTPSQVPAILTSLSGMNYSGFSNSMVQTAQLFMSNFLQMAGGANRNRNRIALAEACDVACDVGQPARWGAWGGGLGGLGTVGSGSSLGGVTYNVGGFAGGLDRALTENFLVGVTVGYTGGTQWVSGFSGQGFTNTVQAGLYASYLQGPAYLDAIVGYAYSNNALNRSIVIPGLAARTATGVTGANQFYGQVEAGWRFDIGTNADAFITPFARLQGYTGTQNAFTENGAQSLSLSVAAQTTNSLRTVLGAQLGGAIDLGWRDKLRAQFRLGWSHELADTSRPVSASFVGAPTAPFTTYGASPSRDGAVVGIMANTSIADGTSIYLRYEGDIAGQDSSHALTAGVRITW